MIGCDLSVFDWLIKPSKKIRYDFAQKFELEDTFSLMELVNSVISYGKEFIGIELDFPETRCYNLNSAFKKGIICKRGLKCLDKDFIVGAVGVHNNELEKVKDLMEKHYPCNVDEVDPKSQGYRVTSSAWTKDREFVKLCIQSIQDANKIIRQETLSKYDEKTFFKVVALDFIDSGNFHDVSCCIVKDNIRMNVIYGNARVVDNIPCGCTNLRQACMCIMANKDDTLDFVFCGSVIIQE